MIEQYKTLRLIEDNLLKNKDKSYKREYFYKIKWKNDVIGIFGERGVGKTTIMIQKRKETKNSFYFSADNVMIKSNGLFKFVLYCFENFDIETFFIDEIFKYTNWKEELKNIIDSFPQLKIIFSGSSSMALYDGIIDLGRRVVDYKVETLSFREFLKLKYDVKLEKISFEDLLEKHNKIGVEYSLKFKKKYFEEYLMMGAYPFGIDLDFASFTNRLQKTLDRIILEDLQYIKNYHTQSLDKLSKLIYFIANTTPSELSINGLSKKIGLDNNVVENVIFLLSKIGTINLVQKGEKLSEKVRKEYKIFLSDTNKYYVNNMSPEKGTIREVFFLNNIKRLENIEINSSSACDFLFEYDGKNYSFEIGGKKKKRKKYNSNIIIAKDGIELSDEKNVIPLWLFGFLV